MRNHVGLVTTNSMILFESKKSKIITLSLQQLNLDSSISYDHDCLSMVRTKT